MKKLTLLPLVLLLSFSFTSLASADDITGNTHEKGLRYLILKNALTADQQDNYYPNQNVTRAEFAHYLAQTLNLTATDESRHFSDVNDTSPYYQSVLKASAAGIVTGYDNETFKPDAYISRVHMAVMIERALNYLDLSIESPNVAKFADYAQIFTEYRQAVNIAAQLNIIQGTKKGNHTYFYPAKQTTRGQAASFIYRTMVLKGDPATNIVLPEIIYYELKEIKNKSLVSTGKKSTSYDAIYKQIKNHNTQVITANDKIVYMKSGLGYVVSNKYIALKSETINDQMAVASGTEMQYSGSDGKNVRVNLAGHVGTVSVADVTLIPFNISKGRSYYKNINGELYHYLVDPSTGNVTASYYSGKAHSSMKANATYYSWDGIYFSGNNQQMTHYNYYQFLPIISKTQYNAEEIDQYIMYALKEREKLGGRYTGASTTSKLVGLGATFKAMEAQYGINAMMILSLALHESDFGMSTHAQTYNNLFGLYVYDTNPLNKEFESIEANILEYVEAFLWAKYIPQSAPFANGAVFGTKRLGMNVKYASDPHWGAKAAGHYYRADKHLGFKDAKKPYTIGVINKKGPQVRAVATKYNNTPLYTYTRQHAPIIITSSHLAGWYEIITEQPGLPAGYIEKANVQVITTTK